MAEQATSPLKSFHKNMHWVKNQELFAREDLLIYLDQTHPRLEEVDEKHEYLHKLHPICGSATGGYCCCRGKSDFAKYGAGIVLYFKYLKYFASIFLIASIFFSIPCMVLYYGKGPLTNEAGNFFNNFLSATTIANIGSGTKLLVESNENKTVILNCPEGSILTGITAMYGEPKGDIDCPAVQQPNSNGKCFETYRNGTCPIGKYCHLARHPTSNSKCCYRTPEGLGDNEYDKGRLSDTKCNSTFASYVINGQCYGKQTCSVEIVNDRDYSWSETETTPCVPSKNAVNVAGECESRLFGPFDEDDVCSPSQPKRIIVTAACYSKEVIGPVEVTISKSFVVYFISILDFALVAFLFIMWYWFKVAETSAAAQAQKITCTVKDYTVIITHLPKHQSIAQLYFWLKTHFDHLLKSYDHPVTGELLEHGRIADINFGYKTEGVGIQLYTKRGSLLLDFQTLDIKQKGLGDWDLTELRACAKERKKLENKLRILDAQIDVWESTLKARAAFVTFESEEACLYIKEIYSTSFHCCNRSLGELSLQNTNIKVKETVDPTDVKWENIGVSPCSAFCRSLFTAIVSVIMIIISFIIIYIAKIYQGKLTDEYDSVDCSVFAPSQLTLVDVVIDVYPVDFHQNVGNTGKLGCFCWNYFLKHPTSVTSQIFSLPDPKLINDKFIEDSRKAAYADNNTFDMNSNHEKWNSDILKPWVGVENYEVSEKLCGNYVSRLALSQGLTIVSVLAVLIINFILTQCIYALIRFERKKSGSGELASLVVKIFISQFLNTAIILLLVNMNLDRFDVSLELFDGFAILGGQWDFFSIKWYSVIGVSIIITMIINIVSGIASPIVGYVLRGLMIWIDRGFSFDPFVTRQKTLTDLEAIYTGKVFFLEQSYAWTLNTMYVCLMYSLGCPFLLIILFCAFTIKYWADKIGFLRVYRTPDKFDSSLPQYVTTIIPWALLIHVILSCIIFSDNLAFQEDPGFMGVVSENEIVGAVTDFFDNSDLKFISQLITHVPHLVVLFVLLALYAIFVILSKLISCKCCKRRNYFYKGLGSYYDKLSLTFLGRSLKTNYVKVANIEKWEELYEKKRTERKKSLNVAAGGVSPTDYDDDDDDIDYGAYMTGIPTYDLCDNTKFQNAFSLNLDDRFFNVRAPIDVLAESYENQRQRDEDMLLLKKGEYSASRVAIIEKLFATADLYDEDETTIGDLALAIDRALPEVTYNTCCCSKPPKIEETICYKIASQIYDICDLDPNSYLNLSYWVNEMYHFTEDFNQFEFATFQSILNPAIKSDLTPYMWDLINKNNEFEAGTGRFKANVQAASIELVNGDYSCIGRRNGGCVFFKKTDECSIILHRVFFKDSYVWRFTQILSEYEPENDDKDPVIVDRHEYLYQAKEMLSIGIPPQGGYAYTNPHDTDVLPPLVHVFGQEETKQARKVNDEKRKRLEKAKEKLEETLNDCYRKIDENTKNIEELKETCLQQENGISILLKQLRDLGDTTARSNIPLRFMEEQKNESSSGLTRNMSTSRRGSVSDKRMSVRSVGAISPVEQPRSSNANNSNNANNNSNKSGSNSVKNTPSSAPVDKKKVVGTALKIPGAPAAPAEGESIPK